MGEKIITVRVHGKSTYMPETPSRHVHEEYKTLEAWRDSDGSIIIERSDGKVVRLVLP